MLLPCHVRVFECMYTRYLTDCQGPPSWKQARSLSDTMEFKVWLNGGVFIYELSSCGFESRCCHTINMKNYLDPRQVSFFDQLGFFPAFSQKIYCCHEHKKNNTLETFSGISFFHVYEILLCKFCSRSMKSIEM